jgi:hypothetical protein
MQQKTKLESPGMRPRLHYIPAQLFGPPTDEARQVFAPSQLDAEKLPPLTSVAVMSTTAPERPATLGEFARWLRMTFAADVAVLNSWLSDRVRSNLTGGFIMSRLKTFVYSSKRCQSK